MRLVLLLAAMLVAAIVTGVIWSESNRGHMFRLREDYQAEKQDFVRQIIDLKSSRLHNFILENTYWDEAIGFLHTGDRHWAKTYLDAPVEFACGSALWVYRRDGTEAYSWCKPGVGGSGPKSADVALALKKLSVCRTLRWFVRVRSQVWVLHGATINV
jgi:hypothetical protein